MNFVITLSLKPIQAIEVSKRQAKVRETPGNAENIMKLEAAETKLQDLKSNMAILGKEAAAAMTAVEAQQQRLTLQRLIAMVLQFHHMVLQYLVIVKSCIKYNILFLPLKNSNLFLIMKVEAERAYHQRVLQILDHLEGEASDVYVMSSDCFRIIF